MVIYRVDYIEQLGEQNLRIALRNEVEFFILEADGRKGENRHFPEFPFDLGRAVPAVQVLETEMRAVIAFGQEITPAVGEIIPAYITVIFRAFMVEMAKRPPFFEFDLFMGAHDVFFILLVLCKFRIVAVVMGRFFFLAVATSASVMVVVMSMVVAVIVPTSAAVFMFMFMFVIVGMVMIVPARAFMFMGFVVMVASAVMIMAVMGMAAACVAFLCFFLRGMIMSTGAAFMGVYMVMIMAAAAAGGMAMFFMQFIVFCHGRSSLSRESRYRRIPIYLNIFIF